jgi:hypothetical protein
MLRGLGRSHRQTGPPDALEFEQQATRLHRLLQNNQVRVPGANPLRQLATGVDEYWDFSSQKRFQDGSDVTIPQVHVQNGGINAIVLGEPARLSGAVTGTNYLRAALLDNVSKVGRNDRLVFDHKDP